MLFLNKSSLVKNSLSSVLPVDPVKDIMTNITFLLKSTFIARHETRNFKPPWDILSNFLNMQMCKSEHQNQSCWACQSHVRHAGHAKPNWLHDRHARHAKPDEQKLGMKHQPGERSGSSGHEPIFSMPMRCYL